MSNDTIGFNNFKAFGEKMQTFSKKPITLIYGPNSVGKSSFIHAMAYKEEMLKKKNFSPIKIEAGDSIDLDGFSSFIHQKKLENHTNFHLKSKDNALLVEIGIANGAVLPLFLQYQKHNIELANISLISDDKLIYNNALESVKIGSKLHVSRSELIRYLVTNTIAIN
jgi:AAA15 family ATPase/GTPase